jgi:hypothetical protein
MTHHGKGPSPTAAGWDEHGCDVCRTQWMKGRRPMLARVDAASHETLYRCGTCGTFWVETERFATAIDATAAARLGAESAGGPDGENRRAVI